MSETAITISSWVALVIGGVLLVLAMVGKVEAERAGLKLIHSIPISALLITTLATTASLQSPLLTLGLILMNLAWAIMLARFAARHRGSESARS